MSDLDFGDLETRPRKPRVAKTETARATAREAGWAADAGPATAASDNPADAEEARYDAILNRKPPKGLPRPVVKAVRLTKRNAALLLLAAERLGLTESEVMTEALESYFEAKGIDVA